jgi:hypothetical protein
MTQIQTDASNIISVRTNWFLDFVHHPEIKNYDVSETGSASVLR